MILSALKSNVSVIEILLFKSTIKIINDQHIAREERIEFWDKAIKSIDNVKSSNFPNSTFTNWKQILDLALKNKPDLLIILTDGFPNWYENKECTLWEDYNKILSTSNTLFENGISTWLAMSNQYLESQVPFLNQFTGYSESTSHINNPNLITGESFHALDLSNWKERLECPLDNSSNLSFSVIPSISNGSFEIIFNEPIESGKIKIYTELAQEVYALTIENSTSRVSVNKEKQFSPGKYVAKYINRSMELSQEFIIVN
jgi:hypothetical protein